MAKLMAGFQGPAPYRRALSGAGFPKAAEDEALTPLFDYLEFCLRQVVADNELGALVDQRQDLLNDPDLHEELQMRCLHRAERQRRCPQCTVQPDGPALSERRCERQALHGFEIGALWSS